MKYRILVVDDEKSIQDLLKFSLSSAGFEVRSSGSIAEAAVDLTQFCPHLVILDLGLPDGSGKDVLDAMRNWTSVPVIVLTVNDSEASKVSLLEAGADDYIVKPFSLPELVARIHVALRRQQFEGASPTFSSDDLTVNLVSRAVQVKGKGVSLTATEFNVLRILIKNAGKVVPQKHLLQEVWGENALENSHYLRIYIKQIRKKIEQVPSSPRHIITEPGVGYRII